MILSAFLDHPSLESNEMKKVSVLAVIVMQTISSYQLFLHYRMFESRVPFFKEVGWGGLVWGSTAIIPALSSQEAEAACPITVRPCLETEAGRDD